MIGDFFHYTEYHTRKHSFQPKNFDHYKRLSYNHHGKLSLTSVIQYSVTIKNVTSVTLTLIIPRTITFHIYPDIAMEIRTPALAKSFASVTSNIF